MKLSNRVDMLLSEAEGLAQSGESSFRRLEAEHQARWEIIVDHWFELAEAAANLMDLAERERVESALEPLAEGEDWPTGPLGNWLRDLAEGRCRLPPDLSVETMQQLLLAFTSPEADSMASVCAQCGLEWPRHKCPPINEWKLLPGKTHDSPPPRYDLPEFFPGCPHCGTPPYNGGMDWPHLVPGKPYAWKQLPGYVGESVQTSPGVEDK